MEEGGAVAACHVFTSVCLSLGLWLESEGN